MKKVLATILALVMALGVTTMVWAADGGPDMSGTVVNVTARYLLNSKSIDFTGFS